MKTWCWVLLLLAFGACRQPTNNNTVEQKTSIRVVPRHAPAPASFFKKYVCRQGDSVLIELYLHKNTTNSNSDSISYFMVSNSNYNGYSRYSGIISPDGAFNFSDYEKNTFAGWFCSDTSIYINAYTNNIDSNGLIFYEEHTPVSVTPHCYYAARQEIPDKSKDRDTFCDYFLSFIDIKSIKVKSDSNNITKLNRLTDAYLGNNIKLKKAPTAYTQFSKMASVIFLSKDFTTVELHDYNHGCGTAHGQFRTTYFNYSFITGDTISLSDIFHPGALNKLTAIAKQKFIARYGNPEEGYSFHLTSNIAVLKSGILFKYQVYEMGPFAAGEMEVFIPYSEVNAILNHTPVTQPFLAGY
ncbi:MAG: hypothetical protein RLZZ367_855 [Bacteroidota bacterium]|jgi:hypothetical protein